METKDTYTKQDMKQSYRKGVKNTLQVAGATALVGYVLFAAGPNEPSPADYKTAEWKESSSTAWEAYMNEDIVHNKEVWADFKHEANKKKSLEGKTLFPDLDGDGKVAQ